MPKLTAVVPVERIERLIFLIRGQKVMLDADLAVLYGVSTKVLVQAVRTWGGRRYAPYAFTEHGVAMRWSVLRSPL